LLFRYQEWGNFYWVQDRIIDAAVLWQSESYIPGSLMCVSCQFQKHLSVGRLGFILCDNENDAKELKRLSHDGRDYGIPWRQQNVKSFGYHFYAQPELCQIALDKLDKAIATEPRKWSYLDYPDLTQMDVFKNK
jgi:dTDP-4-amino-4,6-dideoxygalactose transaminase